MSFATFTVNLSIALAPAVIQDIHTHWLSRSSGQAGVLAAAMASADTTFTLFTGISSNGIPSPASAITVGTTVLIGNDPMQVTAIAGSTYTVSRYTTAFPFMAIFPVAPVTAHAAEEGVQVLINPDPWTLIANEALRPWAYQVAQGLGANSATFGAVTSGSMSAS